MFQFNKILKESDLNPNLWFFFPILISLIIFVSKSIDINFFITYFKGETGIIENTTFLILFISLCVCLSVLNKLKKKSYSKNILFFFIFFLLGLFYFSGEEISWGQQWFKWETNDFFKKINDQSETNFHNVSSWLDQKPRFFLTLFVIAGGLICPFINIKLKNKYRILYPTIYCFPSSFICFFYYILDNSYKFLCHGTPGVDIQCKYIPSLFHIRTSEIIELYISIFLLIYILSVNSKLKN